MITTESTSASASGMNSDSRANDSAANSTIEPWAKLNTPEALKISTKPSATNEYSTPVRSPPIRVSRIGPSIVPSMAQAEIGVDHRLVGLHLGRRAVGDLDAVVEHQHARGQIHHHAHVVLDQRNRGAVVVAAVEDEAGHVLLLLEVHAGHRLVEQQEVGLHGERAAELDPLLQAIGQLADLDLADVLDLEKVDDILHAVAVLDLLLERGPGAQELPEKAAAHLQRPPRHDVVERGHTLEQRDILEGAGDAAEGRVVRPHLGARLALEG